MKYIAKVFGVVSRMWHTKKKLTIITGANEAYYESMMHNLLESVRRHEKDVNVVVWDLGLNDRQKEDVINWLSECLWGGVVKELPREELPPFYADMSTYAFKSYCIYQTMKMNLSEQYIWLDAGCGLSGSLDAERNLISRYGFYSPHSSTTCAALTYATVLDEFGDEYCGYGDKQMLASGVVGFDINDKKAVAVITDWYHLTFKKELLAPEWSNKENHRQDQSLLSMVYYNHNYKSVPLLERRLYNVRIHLNKKLS